jgi:mRNA interferase RelE/StbE
MAYILQIPKTVQKQLQNISEPFHSHIIESLQQLKDDPRFGNAIKMKGSEGYRLRVGNYRILYDINDTEEIITLRRIAHRREVYRSS